MPRRLRILLLALVLATGAVACSSDAPDDASSDTTAAPATSATATEPTTSTTAATPVTAAPGQGPTTPTDQTAQQAGQRLLDAWTTGDLDTAVAVVGSDVANALFSYPTPDTLESLPCRGSETVEAATECDFAYSGGTVTLLITGNAGNGYRVTNVGLIPVQ